MTDHQPIFDKATGQWDAETLAKVARGEWTLISGALVKRPLPPRPWETVRVHTDDYGNRMTWRDVPADLNQTDTPKTCYACAYSCMEPNDDLTCVHADAGSMGLYAKHAAAPDGHCGPARPKFKQHPRRNPDGTLKPFGS